MTHNGIWKAIETLAGACNLSCSGLARQSGLDPTIFNKSKRWTKEGKPRWPSTHSLAKIMASTGIEPDEFVKYIPKSE